MEAGEVAVKLAAQERSREAERAITVNLEMSDVKEAQRNRKIVKHRHVVSVTEYEVLSLFKLLNLKHLSRNGRNGMLVALLVAQEHKQKVGRVKMEMLEMWDA